MDLTLALVVYNLGLVALNLYILIEVSELYPPNQSNFSRRGLRRLLLSIFSCWLVQLMLVTAILARSAFTLMTDMRCRSVG